MRLVLLKSRCDWNNADRTLVVLGGSRNDYGTNIPLFYDGKNGWLHNSWIEDDKNTIELKEVIREEI